MSLSWTGWPGRCSNFLGDVSITTWTWTRMRTKEKKKEKGLKEQILGCGICFFTRRTTMKSILVDDPGEKIPGGSRLSFLCHTSRPHLGPFLILNLVRAWSTHVFTWILMYFGSLFIPTVYPVARQGCQVSVVKIRPFFSRNIPAYTSHFPGVTPPHFHILLPFY